MHCHDCSPSSLTAKLCAYARAQTARESGHPFSDVLASELLGARGEQEILQLIDDPLARSAFDSIASLPAARSAWAEDAVRRFAQRHGHSAVQVVILGAGLDTFAWRSKDPAIRFFEVDHPDTQRMKRERIRELGWKSAQPVVFAGVDFGRERLEERLLEAGLDPRLPTAVTMLGVAYYLPFPAFSETLRALSSLLAGPSLLLLDFQTEGYEALKRPRELARFAAQLGEPMVPGYGVARLESRLFEEGWRYADHLTPGRLELPGLPAPAAPVRFESIHFLAATRDPETFPNLFFS